MRIKGIMAGGALLGLVIGTTAAIAQPMGTVPPAGAYYGDGALPSPGFSQWQPAQGPHPRMDHHGYHEPRRGAGIGDIWRDPAYAVNDWQAWGLTPPGPGMHWLRYYDDAVLVDGSGHVVDSRQGMAWDAPHGPMHGGPGYAGGPGYPGPGYGGPGWHGGPDGGTSVYHAGPNTTVTTQVIGGAPGYGYGGGYGGAYPVGAGTLIITPGSVVTTTTTTSDEVIYRNSYRRRAWHRPVRHYRPRCVQAPTCPVVGS
jgi:hypothetical protein